VFIVWCVQGSVDDHFAKSLGSTWTRIKDTLNSSTTASHQEAYDSSIVETVGSSSLGQGLQVASPQCLGNKGHDREVVAERIGSRTLHRCPEVAGLESLANGDTQIITKRIGSRTSRRGPEIASQESASNGDGNEICLSSMSVSMSSEAGPRSVDDHFAKALGAAWFRIKAEHEAVSAATLTVEAASTATTVENS